MSQPFTTRLRNITARPLVRNTAKVLTGNIAGNALNFFAMIWLGVALGPAALGVFTPLQAFVLLFVQLSDFGLNTTIIKYYRDFVSAHRTEDAEALMRRSLLLRMAIIGAAMVVCIIFAVPIARYGFKEPGSANLFRIACLGAVGGSLWAFCQTAMQARQQFTLYAALTTANHALRFLLIWGLIRLGHLSLAAAMIIMMAVPFLGIISSVRLWPRAFWTARMEPAAMRRQMIAIFHFSKWVFYSTIIASIIMRLDVFLLKLLRRPEDVGQYGMASNLALGITLVTAALSTVLLPKLAATRRKAEMKRIVGIFMKATPFLAAGVAVVIVMAHLLVPRLMVDYTPALPVFDLLAIAYTISVVVTPLSFLCLAWERASWLTWMNLAQLVINAGMSLLLIPHFGAMGAGISALLVRLFALVFLALAFRRLLKLADQAESVDSSPQASHTHSV